jgi:hypothetical protein
MAGAPVINPSRGKKERNPLLLGKEVLRPLGLNSCRETNVWLEPANPFEYLGPSDGVRTKRGWMSWFFQCVCHGRYSCFLSLDFEIGEAGSPPSSAAGLRLVKHAPNQTSCSIPTVSRLLFRNHNCPVMMELSALWVSAEIFSLSVNIIHLLVFTFNVVWSRISP